MAVALAVIVTVPMSVMTVSISVTVVMTVSVAVSVSMVVTFSVTVVVIHKCTPFKSFSRTTGSGGCRHMGRPWMKALISILLSFVFIFLTTDI
jgi:hypothetical protein